MSIHWTRRAEQQLVEIGRFIARDRPHVARRWVEMLRRRAVEAGEHPLAGRIVPELDREDIREVITRGYRIVYRVEDAAVEILSVFEGHRLLRSALGDSGGVRGEEEK